MNTSAHDNFVEFCSCAIKEDFDHLWYADFPSDRGAGFDAQTVRPNKETALHSIVEKNRALQVSAHDWNEHIEAFYYHKEHSDYDDGWSMKNSTHRVHSFGQYQHLSYEHYWRRMDHYSMECNGFSEDYTFFVSFDEFNNIYH